MTIILKGNPMSTQHIYGQKGRIRYMKTNARNLKENYAMQAMIQYAGKQMITDYVEVKIKIYFKDRIKRDRDNFHKLSVDSLCGVVIKDDSQIKKATVELSYDKHNPRYEIVVKLLPWYKNHI